MTNALLDVIDNQRLGDYVICQRAGVAKDTLNFWRRGHKVYMVSLEAIANVVGYEVALIRKVK